MEIQKLKWDSDFFGYPVGRLDLGANKLLDLKEFVAKGATYKLIYIFAETELIGLPKSCQLVDRKVTFKRKANTIDFSGDVRNLKSYEGSLTDEFISLTLQSGVYSRFKIDKKFKKSEFERLYSKWIMESLSRRNALDVYIYTADESLLGFITLGEKNHIADIGLIAVSENARGAGIGSLLVNYGIYNAYLLGYPEIQVVTQGDNVAAVKLYENTGFVLNDIKYVYHFWNY